MAINYSIDVLYANAKLYANQFTQEDVKWLKREPKKYFGKLKHNILTPILKDRGGHRQNPINDRVKGVFFMVAKDLEDVSFFGSIRYCVEI